MTNGVAHALYALEPTPVVALEPAGATEIERKLGEEVATGVIALCQVIVGHYERRVFDPEVKNTVATQVAAVAMLQLDHEDDDDFIRKASKAGRARLHRYFDGYNIPSDADPIINICMEELLALTTQIARDERIYRVALAN